MYVCMYVCMCMDDIAVTNYSPGECAAPLPLQQRWQTRSPSPSPTPNKSSNVCMYVCVYNI